MILSASNRDSDTRSAERSSTGAVKVVKTQRENNHLLEQLQMSYVVKLRHNSY